MLLPPQGKISTKQGRRIDTMNGDREPDNGENIPSSGGMGDFIPGLPNDIVLHHVTPRFAWNTMLTLTAVNRPWRQAIRSREVHQLKKRTSSAQTLVVFHDRGDRLALYDVVRREVYLLPPHHPRFKQSIEDKHIVVFDGKIYVMGMLCEDLELSESGGTIGAVLVLDIVACQEVWTCFSSSRNFRSSDVCIPCDGKIYIFDERDLASGELFDPGSNERSRIAGPTGNEIIDYRPCFSDVKYLNKDIYFFSGDEERNSMVYNTEAKSWRAIETTAPGSYPKLCVMDGRLYSFECRSVAVYSAESNGWTHFQSISILSVEAGVPVRVIPFGTEVLALLEFSNTARAVDFSNTARAVYRSVGFGVEGEPFLWEEIRWEAFQDLSRGYYIVYNFRLFLGCVEF